MLMMSFGPVAFYALMAAFLGALGLSAKRPRLEGEDYYKEHIEGRFRSKTYVLRHPVETVRRFFR